MEKTRTKFYATYVLVLGLNLITVLPTDASVTKVGNGNDGADLEVLTPITSGPIFDARQQAVQVVTKLNVAGVPGMGLLVPEIERSNLFMSKTDVHPTGEQSGSVEVSNDKGHVYARTFAEPYAATRFFPIALTLNSEQLIALHIHEALHRALPPEIRTDENKVMHLTLALTSPGASYDRVRQVAGLYLNLSTASSIQNSAAQINSNLTIAPMALPEKSKTEFKIGPEVYNEMTFAQANNFLTKLEIQTSLGGYKQISSYAVEPVFRFRGTHMQSWQSGGSLGPSSYDLEARVRVDEQTVTGPFVRFTAKSMDDSLYTLNERDLTTIGAFYRKNSEGRYLETILSYSFGSTANGLGEEMKAEYKPIISVTARTGIKWGRLSFGGLFELHSSQGREFSEYEQYANSFDQRPNYFWQTQDSTRLGAFRILAIGPELGYEGKSVQFKLFGKKILNKTNTNFDDLGDVMDRGAGEEVIGTSLGMLF